MALSSIPAILTPDGLSSIIATFIKFIVGTFIARTIAAFGISVTTYTLNGSVGAFIKGHFLSVMSGGGGQAIEIATALGVISAANIIFSAFMGALAIRAAMGFYKRLTFGN